MLYYIINTTFKKEIEAKMKKINKYCIIFLSVVIMLIFTPLANGSETSETFRKENLHRKSELSNIALINLKQIYFFNERETSDNKMTENQFLDYTLLFENIFIKHVWYNDLLVQFSTKDIAYMYKGKKVDLYGSYYGYQCAGGKPNRTACMYGGVTLHDNNQLTEEKKIKIYLTLDGIKTPVPLDTVKTKKKKVTLQELDLQARYYLQKQYQLYNSNNFGGKIQRGLIVFHGSSNPIISYDLFGAKGQYSDTMLRIYQDNKTVDSENVHIDLYLYTN